MKLNKTTQIVVSILIGVIIFFYFAITLEVMNYLLNQSNTWLNLLGLGVLITDVAVFIILIFTAIYKVNVEPNNKSENNE